MPAKKPVALISKHLSKNDRHHREEREESLIPKRSLSSDPPSQLTGEVERATWRETVRQYMALDAIIVSALDRGVLLDYCMACEQLEQIDGLRSTAMSNYSQSEARLANLLKRKKDSTDPKTLLNLVDAVNRSFNEIVKLDARADNKRKLIHIYRQSLMLTPRSRGGVVPDEKPKKKPPSEMARLIDGEITKPKEKKNGDAGPTVPAP